MATNKKRQNTDAIFASMFAGVSNFDKLKVTNSSDRRKSIHKFMPFLSSTYAQTANDNAETESTDIRFLDPNLYAQMMSRNRMWSNKYGSVGNIFAHDAKRKRQAYIELSSYDKIDEVLSKLTDEIIVYSKGEKFASVSIDRMYLEKIGVKESVIDLIERRADEIFNFIYRCYGFKEEGSRNSAWNKTYQYLVEGGLAFEILYDDIDNPKKIIGIRETDYLQLNEVWKDGVRFWEHEKVLDARNRRVLLYDSQIIMIRWSDSSANNKFSYLESLIRSFNVTRIMEESKIIWYVTNSQFRTLFTIPTKQKSRIKAAQTLAIEQQRHRDDISFDYASGELLINGSTSQEFQKQYFMADGDSGSPSISTIGGDGPDLSDNTALESFDRKFYRNARIPYSRFDAGSSDSWNLDSSGKLREEISFDRFVARAQAPLSMLLLKPLIMQLAMDIPEIKNDDQIIDAIQIKWNSYGMFEELMHQEVLSEKIAFIEKMRESLKTTTADGDEIPFFSMKFLTEKFLKEFTEADLELNRKYLIAEQEEKYAAQERLLKLNKKYENADNDASSTDDVSW